MDGESLDTKGLPKQRRAQVEAQLQPGETVLAWFAPDLDERLHFAESLVVLTNRRLLSFGREGTPTTSAYTDGDGGAWRSWPLADVARLSSKDRGGVGTLALCRHLRAAHPGCELIAGGGVRGPADLELMAGAGCDAALVASALHDGRLTREMMRNYR